MQKLIETLKSFGIEVPEDKQAEVKKALSEHYKNVSEHTKAISKLETDRDNWKQKAEAAEETLKKFDGVDLETMQSELTTWKNKAENAEKDYAEKIRERDIRDKVNEKLSGVKMKDDMKDFVYEEILKTGVDLNKNGELIGFDEGLKSVQEKRPSAFIDEEQERLEAQRAKEFKPFTQPLNGKQPMTSSEKFKSMSLDERMKLKASDPAAYERLRKGE